MMNKAITKGTIALHISLQHRLCFLQMKRKCRLKYVLKCSQVLYQYKEAADIFCLQIINPWPVNTLNSMSLKTVFKSLRVLVNSLMWKFCFYDEDELKVDEADIESRPVFKFQLKHATGYHFTL